RVIWFSESPAWRACIGLAEFKQCRTEGRKLGFVRRGFHTKLVDLRATAEELLAGFQPRTRSMVRQAQKLGVTTGVELDHRGFLARYNAFAAQRGLAELPENHPLAVSGPSIVTAARLDRRVLVMRGYLADRGAARVRNLVSCTELHAPEDAEARKLTGLAHRLLVLEDMLRFRSEGFRDYDFGGYAVATEDPKLASINRFKDSFGGRVVAEPNYLSLPLHVCLTLRDWARQRNDNKSAHGDSADDRQ
ncbi:MAG: hypothetical protein AB7X49_12790, partial [Geminicoccaceae bacterium]